MITAAVRKTPQSVWVYDERGSARQLSGTLLGYTSQTVTIKPLSGSHTAYIYNEKGQIIRSVTGMQVKSRGVLGKRLKILMLRSPF